MSVDEKYEDEITRSFEEGDWKPVKNLKKEMARYRAAATETLLKNKRVNIRISAMDLEGLQAKAAGEGLPYQTLMASVLHKYVSGRLIDGPIGRESRTGRFVDGRIGVTTRTSVRTTKRRAA